VREYFIGFVLHPEEEEEEEEEEEDEGNIRMRC
jgi:hypothetical protein